MKIRIIEKGSRFYVEKKFLFFWLQDFATVHGHHGNDGNGSLRGFDSFGHARAWAKSIMRQERVVWSSGEIK